MRADELRAKARERLSEIASERHALDAEEAELRKMLGETPAPILPAPPFSPGPFMPAYPPPIWIGPIQPSDWHSWPQITCHARNP